MSLELSTDNIIVRGANVDLANLPERAPKELARAVAKHFNPLHGASIFVTRERRLCRCTIKLQAGTAGLLASEASGFSCHEAFDGGLKKMVKQLRRRKRSLESGYAPPAAGGDRTADAMP